MKVQTALDSLSSDRSSDRPSVLVTGAAGFLGAHLTRELVKMGSFHVVALDDLSGGFEDNLVPNVKFVRGSITDEFLLARLFEQYKFEYVYHLAAYAAEGLSHFIRKFNYTNNLIGTINLINESVKAETKCLVFTSSIAVYGAIEPPMREDKRPRPEDPYGISKLAAEMDLHAAKDMFGLNYVVFRPHNVYGEYQNLSDPYRNVIGIFMAQIMRGQPMTIFGDGEQTRAFSYVGDIVPAIANATLLEAAHNEVFNVGADEPYSVNELARQVAVAMDVPGYPVVHLAARNEVQQAFSDHTKAKNVFSLASPTTLPEGLARMAKWAKTTKLRPLEGFASIEVEKNMPVSWMKYRSQSA